MKTNERPLSNQTIPTNGTVFDKLPAGPLTLKLTREKLAEFYEGVRGNPADLRRRGGSVAAHYDYINNTNKDGERWTYWLITFPLGPDRLGKPHLIALVGDAKTDVEALDKIRAQYAELTDHLHHAPMCPANHYHGMRAPIAPCNCGAVEMQIR